MKIKIMFKTNVCITPLESIFVRRGEGDTRRDRKRIKIMKNRQNDG